MKSIFSYAVIGFTDKNKKATFRKEGYTEIGGNRVFEKLVKSGEYQCVVLREEEKALDCNFEASTPVKVWEMEG